VAGSPELIGDPVEHLGAGQPPRYLIHRLAELRLDDGLSQ